MVYTVGISTGMWNVGRDPGLLGLAQKIVGWGGTTGVRMVQIDVDTTAEFYEPDVEKMIQRVTKKYNMVVGVHGEIGELMSFDSAQRAVWHQSHLRLCETLCYAQKFGAIYVNVHLSANRFLTGREYESQRVLGSQTPVVSFDGKPLSTITKGTIARRVAIERLLGSHYLSKSDAWRIKSKEVRDKEIKKAQEILEKEFAAIDKDQTMNAGQKEYRKREVEQFINGQTKDNIDRIIGSDDFQYEVWAAMDPKKEIWPFTVEDGEYGCYQIVAAYLKDTNDYLWQTIAGNGNPETLISENPNAFHAAVAAKYLEGHIMVKDHPANIKFLGGMSILEFVNKTGIKLLFEVPESGGQGGEGQYRLYNPIDAYHLLKKLKSPNVKLCIDFEHMLSHKLEPEKIFNEAPGDFGAQIFLFHLGKPVAYGGTAHIPIARGSRAQEILYGWIYTAKKKGFKNGYIIFERGSGRGGRGATHMEVLEDSVQAVRLIAEFLEKDIDPKNLPLEFYGISEKNKEVWAREMALMRDHAYDPLSGLLTIPEETHTFFSRSAIDKGKQKEWDRAKFR